MFPLVKRRHAVLRSGSTAVALATEEVLIRFDRRRGMAGEVLLMSGCVFRGDRRQISLTDYGNTKSVQSVIGSVRQLRVEHGKLMGNVYFASDTAAQAMRQKYVDGHITTIDVDVDILDGIELREGETNRGYTGPCLLATQWRPLVARLKA